MVDFGPKRKARKNGEFLRGVMTLDIETRIGFGITEPLCLLKAFSERHLILLHPRKDVVAGAIEDAVDTLE